MFIELGFIAIGLTLVLQLCGTVWWAGNMNSRVKTLEDKVAVIASLPERLARLETVAQTLVQTSQRTDTAVQTVKDFMLAQSNAESSRLKQLVEGLDLDKQ